MKRGIDPTATQDRQQRSSANARSFKVARAASLRGIAALLGLLFFCQAASAALTSSPNPSYDGSYTVSWGYSLGCTVYIVYGFPMDYCYHLAEYPGTTIHIASDTATSGTFKSYSGKGSGTYTYVIWVNWSWAFGSGTDMVEGPLYQQVILPAPVPNSNYQHWSGPGNDIQSYRLFWNASYATSCVVHASWWLPGQVLPQYEETTGSLPTSYQVFIGKRYSNTDYVRARVTCYGAGGEGVEEHRLEFNQFGS
jgi:hypothetical protein